MKTLEGFGGGITHFCLENEDMGWGVGGGRESHQMLLGDHCSEVTFKGGIG